MSYVHFLDVFDPAGLPAGLSDRDAAEQARGLRLAEPSPRLLALLTRIRQQPPGITVNVVGGKDQQPVEWVAGEPPRVEGDGANFALWTLILPVEEDMEELQEAVPQIEAWAKALGLRVFDEVQEAFARPVPAAPPVAVPLMDGQELPGLGDILILQPGIWGRLPISESMRIRGLTVRQSVQSCMLSEVKHNTAYREFALRRFLVRLLQIYPFETYGQKLWCGRNPLTDPIFKRLGLRLIRIAPEHRIEVLKHLLPLARELSLTVAVPEMDLFVERTGDPSDFNASPFFDIGGLDPDWNKHRLTPKQSEKLLFRALCDALAPHGFQPLPDVAFKNLFSRPLRGGGGRQVIRFGDSGSGMGAFVQSERLLSIKHACGWKVDLTSAEVVSLSRSDLRQQDDPDTCYLGLSTDSPEEIAWAVEDIQRFVLPQLDRLHTAQDLWQRLSQPDGDFPGFSDVDRLKEWFMRRPGHTSCSTRLYAARCLPDEEFEPLLQMWEEALRITLQMHPEREPIKNSLKYAAAFRQLPQTPMDAPF